MLKLDAAVNFLVDAETALRQHALGMPTFPLATFHKVFGEYLRCAL